MQKTYDAYSDMDFRYFKTQCYEHHTRFKNLFVTTTPPASIEYPDLVSRVALLNPVFRRSPEARAAVEARAAEISRGELDSAAPLARWFTRTASERAAREATAGWLRAVSPEGYATAYTAFATGDETYANRIGDIQAPLLALTGSGDGNTVESNNTENSNNTTASGNEMASNNVVGADNTLASGNDILTGNDAFSSNSTLSENDVAVDRSFGSDNEIASNNSLLSDNAIGSNNTVTSETTKIEIENEAEISVNEVAAATLVAADDEAEVLLDDLSVDYGTLTGAGNDMAFDLDQANTLVDGDTLDDISLTLAGSFEQTVEATAGEAYADDATDGGAGTMLSDIIGNVAIDVQNTADASAVANAQGITQTIASGGNVMLNSLDMSITGGDSSFAQTADDIIA
jgi:hypothetical protein